jgi:HlyD family secretion protein
VVGMRDAMAAGALFGISEEQMRAALRGNRGGAAEGAAAQGAANGQPGSGPAANGAATEGAAATAAAPASAPAAAQPRQGRGGDNAARGAMRGGMGTRGGGAMAAAGGDPDVRPGIVFVQTATGVEPRSVLLGVNDWDYTEVIRGVEPGERVMLISVARLQQQQQEMLDRMRQRNSGPFPGAGRR